MADCEYCGLLTTQCICDDNEPYEGVCPQCNAIWGMDEVDRERCFACGWPVTDIQDEDET